MTSAYIYWALFVITIIIAAFTIFPLYRKKKNAAGNVIPTESLDKTIYPPSPQLPERQDEEVGMNALRQRMLTLNRIAAEAIASEGASDDEHRKWVKHIFSQKKQFMNDTHMTFRVTHPGFIDYLRVHDLTDDEIDYVCLYALGLRGKEVGVFLKMRSHVNISSRIRAKLGIDRHETNLGIYIRRKMNENH